MLDYLVRHDVSGLMSAREISSGRGSEGDLSVCIARPLGLDFTLRLRTVVSDDLVDIGLEIVNLYNA